MRALVLVAAAGCWTGGGTAVSEPASADGVPAASAPTRAGFKLRLERTPCLGACPTYMLVIQANGRVDWTGTANVLAYGARSGQVTREELVELEQLVMSLRFFDRDEYGHLPVEQQCITSNGTTTCSIASSFAFCSDTSHTVITVTRERKTHRVDNANCSDDDELAALEHLVNRIANVRAWVHE